MVRPDKGDWDTEVKITQEVRDELMEIVKMIRVWNKRGAPLRRKLGPTELHIISDAVPDGYGYRLDGKATQIQMGDSGIAEARLWDSKKESGAAQVHRELYGIERCVVAEAEKLRGHSVLVLSDAMAAVAYINKGSVPSDEMTAVCTVMKRNFRVCVQNETSLRSEHLKGVSVKEAGVPRSCSPLRKAAL